MSSLDAKRPARVLLVYASRPPILDYLQKAFSRRQIEVQSVFADDNTWFDRKVIHRINKWAHSLRILPKNRNYFEQHPLAHKNFRSEKLHEVYDSFQPDLVLLIRGISFRHDVLKMVRPLFGWWIEHEGRVDEALAEISNFDWYFFMSDTSVQKAHQAGYSHASYLAHAVDPGAFFPIGDVKKKFDVCFVGGWSPKRQAYIENTLALTSNVAIYGGKWLRKCWNRPAILSCWKGSYIEGDDLNCLYNESQIVLNITNWGSGEGAARSGMNMRVLEVPATGSFLFTDTSKELEQFLTPGIHIGTHDSPEAFKSGLAYFLSHDAERVAIAFEGMNHVRSRHTYDHIVQEILRCYDALDISRKKHNVALHAGYF